MRRTGIDLSSTRCILADVETPATERRTGERRGFRVHRYASLSSAESSQALAAELTALMARKEFPQRAWINLWGFPGRPIEWQTDDSEPHLTCCRMS